MSSGNLKGVQSCHAMYYMLENWTSDLQLDALQSETTVFRWCFPVNSSAYKRNELAIIAYKLPVYCHYS